MTMVSIGMPVYNAEKYLNGALAALSSQTFSDLRIIVSDNASTDSTPEIITTWAARDARITSHRQPENLGAMANFEWVLQHAESTWFMFAAYDDTWSPNYVEVLYRMAISRPGLKLAAPQVVQVNPDLSERRRIPFFDPLRDASGLNRIRLLLKHVRSGWYYGLFNRSALIDAWNKSRAFKYAWASDYLMLLPILLSGDVTGSNDAMFFQRITRVTDAYIPSTLSSQKDLFRTFFRESLQMIKEAPFSAIERAMLYLLMISYADAHAWRIRRLVRSSLKEFFGIVPST